MIKSKIFGKPSPRKVQYSAVSIIAFFAALFAGIVLSALDRQPAPQTILYKWIQLVPGDDCWGEGKDSCKPRVLVRFIVEQGESCPTLYYDTGPEQVLGITRRENPTPGSFPVEVCEVLLSNYAATSIRFPDDSTLTVPKLGLENYLSPNRIVILGDTGCRGRNQAKRETNQPCKSPDKWPFDKIAESAVSVLSKNNLSGDNKAVNLIMHVGDYVYGEFYGRDHWELWKKEFFEPAKALLGAAPWIFTRGNHEICFNNSAYGWFLFLDYPESSGTRRCKPGDVPAITTRPYALDLADDLRVVVMDTANAHPEAKPQKEIRKKYSRQFSKDLLKLTKKNKKADKKVWILTHVPFRGLEQPEENKCEPKSCEVEKKGGKSGAKTTCADTAECNARFIPDPTKFLWPMVVSGTFEKNVEAVIAGDRHDFQWVKVKSNNNIPVQLTFGHGGVKLDKDIGTFEADFNTPNSIQVKLKGDDVKITVNETWLWKKVNEFGYAIAVKNKDKKTKEKSWTFQVWTANLNDNSTYIYKYYCTLDPTDNKPCKLK